MPLVLGDLVTGSMSKNTPVSDIVSLRSFGPKCQTMDSYSNATVSLWK
jgi:hypothetical protein